jgi:signal transduction histidine kinase
VKPFPDRPATPPSHIRLPRRTIRLRLTVLYGALFLACGVLLLGMTYVLVEYNFPVVRIDTITGPADSSAFQIGFPGLSSFEAQVAQEHDAELHQLLVQSCVALAITAVISAGLGWLVAGRVLRPLRTITSAARDISSTNLNRRLALAGPDDELKELGDTFDDLLARLERSFSSQRQFVANASHELRTPLALEQALLEDILTDPDPTAESWRTTCERVLAASRQQERLIEALLTLARSEGGLDRRQPLDLGALTRQVLLGRHAEAQGHGLQLVATTDPAPTEGDPGLVERLIANLVDNAILHNLPAGRVEVITGCQAGHPALTVTNTGPLIPASEVSRLFQPFQRLNRQRTGPGIGLGLSIVQAIALAHHATIAAHPNPGGGMAIAVTFPVVTPHPATGPETTLTSGPGVARRFACPS